MANDNNNINDLVADDDDPTVELQTLLHASDTGPEADAKTFDGFDVPLGEDGTGVTVSELKSDLRLRTKTIGKLQYDIEQLHAKWLGLETEIGARETQTEKLNSELISSQDAVQRKEKLLKERDRKIKSLKSEIRQRDDEHRQLQIQYDELQREATERAAPDIKPETHQHDGGQDDGGSAMQLRLERSEQYADGLRQQCQDLIAANSKYESETENLTQLVNDAASAKKRIQGELEQTLTIVDDLRAELDSIRKTHQGELRTLRFELGAAQDTVVETDDLNSQLASDLVDARGFKEELERMLGDIEEQSSTQIEKLQKELTRLKRKSDNYERKLTTKSEAISVLLAELAKKSEQIESIGEIEGVIHDIDERMSERSLAGEGDGPQTSIDRLSRVLIGTVDDQVLRFPLFKDRLTIGRTKDNDIQLKAAYVSRRHAVIQTEEGTTRIIDWGSKNGIHINTTKVSEHILLHGDIVTIGEARFRYEERKKRES